MNKEKTLLYYEDFSKMHRHYNGCPIFSFRFHNVKTGKEMKLFYSDAAVDLNNIGFGGCYEDINDFAANYDIIWILTSTNVLPIEASFREVHDEYALLKSTTADINDTMMSKYVPNYIKKCDSIQNRMTLREENYMKTEYNTSELFIGHITQTTDESHKDYIAVLSQIDEDKYHDINRGQICTLPTAKNASSAVINDIVAYTRYFENSTGKKVKSLKPASFDSYDLYRLSQLAKNK